MVSQNRNLPPCELDKFQQEPGTLNQALPPCKTGQASTVTHIHNHNQTLPPCNQRRFQQFLTTENSEPDASSLQTGQILLVSQNLVLTINQKRDP